MAGFDPLKPLDSKILSLTGVQRRKSRWGNHPAYFVDDREFVHFHSRREIDIRLTRRFQRLDGDKLRRDPRIGFRKGNSEWITFAVRTREDLEVALQLIKLACEGNREG